MSEVQEAPQVQPKVAANVVTSENLAEFNAKKMGLADKAPVAAAVETPPAEPTETQSQSEPLGEDEATATEERKRNPKLELRFEKITKQREEARQEAKREREARESLEAKIRELEGKVTPKAETQPTGEPKPENFSDMYEYAKALTDYRVEPLGEDEATATEERKRNPKLELRFEKITKQREEARQEAKREREARESLEAKIRELEGKVTPKAETQPTGEPKPENFSDMYEYAKALTDYRVEQRLSEEKQKEAQAKQQAEREKVINTWTERVKAAKSEMPDFDDMVGSADVVVSNEVRDAIFESDVGPRILYHLAENPEFAEKLSGMTVASALRSIGKLEAQFEKTEPTSKTVVGKSKAPAPINPIRSAANGRDVPLTSDGKFEGSYQAYKAARLAGRIR